MNTKMRAKIKKLVVMIIMLIITANLFPTKVNADETSNVLTPTENQYLELRAVDVQDVDGQDKQVIMELWAHDLEFKGFQVRFSYDDTKLQPSNISTNVVTDDSDQYFKFENEFDGKLDFFAITYSGEGTGIEAIVSLDPPVETSSHIKSRGANDYYIDGSGDLLLGKMSFHMTESVYEDGWLSLVTSSTQAPSTGIKISVTIPTYYEDQSTFRFTDETASRDANLSNIVVSHGEVNDTNPEESTYKEYTLVPVFHQDTLDYEIELTEYIDDLDITSTLNDDRSTMKIEVPKRDEDDKLVYEGSAIVYEEKELTSGVPLNVLINKLGEPDTILKVTVTAEDGVTEKEYTVTIKRPYATLKGKSILADFDDPDVVANIEDNYGVTVTNRTTINLYGSGLARWEEIPDIYAMTYATPFTYDDLEEIEKIHSIDTEDDGTFEIYIIPGEYDVQVTRLAYLDYIYVGVVAHEGDVIEMGDLRLPAGDIDRNGVITAEDTGEIKAALGAGLSSSDPDFSERYNPTQIGEVITEDMAYVKGNQDLEIQVVHFSN